MTAEQLRQAESQFKKDGFAVILSFVNREEVNEINDEIERYVADVIPTLPPEESFYEIKGDPATLKQLPRISEHNECFHRFQCHLRMSMFAGHVLRGDVVPRDLQWFNKPPGQGKPTSAHQAGFYDKIESIEMVNMWLALDPADK